MIKSPLQILFLVIGIVILGFIALFFRFDLQVKNAFIIAKTIQEFQCTNGYSWQIVEDGKFYGGDERPTPAGISYYRVANLRFGNDTIATLDPHAIKNQAYGAGFPVGEAFLMAFIFDMQAITPGLSNKSSWSVLRVPATNVDSENFAGIARCLNENKEAIQDSLKTATPIFPIGWVMFTDDSVRRENGTNAPEFICPSGKKIVTFDQFLQTRPLDFTALIAPDGTLYKPNGLTIDLAQPKSSIPEGGCINSNGETLENVLSSIPSRITVLKK